MKKEEVTDIWEKYQRSLAYLQGKGLIKQTDENWNFYLGNQWKGLRSGDEKMPQLNFIKGIVKYKTAVVAQNSMAVNYSDMDGNAENGKVCDLLNKHFAKHWEKGKMDAASWDLIKSACIAGDAYLFYGTADTTKPQRIPNTNVFLSDEQNQDLQKQKYIMIYERLFLSDIKKTARENGLSKEEVESITSDEPSLDLVGNKAELRGSAEDGKCSCILYMSKDEEGIVHICRSTKTVIYAPDMVLMPTNSEGETIGTGLRSYPIISFVWEKAPGSARGNSEVKSLVPNQIELNRTLARRSMAVKMTAFPRIAYDENAIQNPEALDKVGASIAVKGGNAQNINQMIAYLNAASISGDAKLLSDELMHTTRELAGAGDSATGQVDPTKASGAAIIAVRDQSTLPLNEQIAAYKQFVEDVALLWFDIWVAYNPNGIAVETEEDGEDVRSMIGIEQLENMKVSIKVDVAPDNPWSKFSQQQTLDNLLGSNHISFEEYVELLDDSASVPKGKLQVLLEKRMANEAQMEETQGLEGMANEMQNMQYSNAH